MSEESDKEANSEGSETPAEETAPKNSKPAPDEALGEFLKTLSKQASEELKAEVKMTPGGLFVSETQLASVSELFASFLRNAGDSACTDAKAQQRMFGKAPEPRYLIEGKRCMRGQLASYPHSSPQSFSLPTFIGDTLSAKSMLHPRDPGLNSIEGLTNEMSGSSQVLSIEWQRGKLTLGSKLLEQF